jgi:dihydrofolate reductase
MRSVSYGGACSLDGYLTGPDGALDWLHFSPDVQRIVTEYWKGIDTILMGRKTWEIAAASGGGGGGGGSAGIATVLFSRTLRDRPPPGVTLVSDDAGGYVRALKAKPGKNICLMGGGELAHSLFEAGVVDEVGLNIHPVLLGGGVPVFLPSRHRVRLALVENRTLDGGCVMATYRVVHA